MKKELLLSPSALLSPGKKLDGSILVKDDRILEVRKSPSTRDFKSFDLKGTIGIPALIDAHDHLFGCYYPKVVNGPYYNWAPWDADLKGSPVYSERAKTNPHDRYLLGCYRHLLCGCLTVSDHFPHRPSKRFPVGNEEFIHDMPIKILNENEYSLAHEVSSYELSWGEGVEVEHARAVKKNIPFITHIEEGFDEESMKGIDYLLEMKALSEHTVLVHGIALSNEDIEAIAEHGSHLVWCPVSNFMMFNRTARIKENLLAGVNVSLGTDSPATGGINIFDEMRFAKLIYREMYHEELSDQILLEMLTSNPAKALHLDHNLGSIAENKIADLVFFKEGKGDPYAQFVNLDLNDIELVFHNGLPIYGSQKYAEIFEWFEIPYYTLKVNQSIKISSEDMRSLLKKIRKDVGFKKEIPFLPLN